MSRLSLENMARIPTGLKTCNTTIEVVLLLLLGRNWEMLFGAIVLNGVCGLSARNLADRGPKRMWYFSPGRRSAAFPTTRFCGRAAMRFNAF